MQYKIPVQIENEDKIVFGLSLRQLFTILIGGGIGYSIIKNSEPYWGKEIALVVGGAVAFLAIAIALWNVAEMTFIPFALNFLRTQTLNSTQRIWSKGVDCFSELDIGYLQSTKIQEKFESKNNSEVYDTLEDQLDKI
ncbi:MAG: PrgI family protein [Candidatus Gracilibacteria bacterium]|nr:PrgI family protein [Candidatus Gracilibacteria bacterium]